MLAIDNAMCNNELRTQTKENNMNNDIVEKYNLIINTISQDHYKDLVPQHLMNDINYMKKCIDSNDNWMAYHVHGTIVKKLINLNKPSDF